MGAARMFLVDDSEAAAAQGQPPLATVPASCRIAASVTVLARAKAERIERNTALLDDARRCARRLVREAQRESEAIRRAAYQAGLSAGRADGFRHACDAIQAFIDALRRDESLLADLLSQALDALLGERPEEDLIRAFVARGIRRLGGTYGAVVISVHPSRCGTIEAAIVDWQHAYPELSLAVNGVADLGRRSYRIVGGHGAARWCIEDDLDRALEKLKHSLAGGSNEGQP